MLKKLVLLIIIIIIFSCNSKVKEKIIIPANILTEKQMISILTDIYITESALNFKQNTGKVIDDNIAQCNYKVIFTKHLISKETFKKSYEFYFENPENMAHIYEQILVELNKIQTKNNTNIK